MSNYCVCCGREIPEGGLACKKCLERPLDELVVRVKLCEIMKKAFEPIQYGGDLYAAPEVYYPNEEDVLDAMLSSGLIKLNFGGKTK
jgi:hypothetical protein